ncbi:MAG: hypothetical protein KatS3mg105_4756 [Gemmatales bacterium]|nr:MAG: hypothetical protein KatS3mg105_4756 [Gemmatales bacterium]
MSHRFLTLLFAALVVSAGTTLAKPPDLPTNEQVDCQIVVPPFNGGYIPGGCIQLENEAILEAEQPVEPCEPSAESPAPCVSEALCSWLSAVQFWFAAEPIIGCGCPCCAISEDCYGQQTAEACQCYPDGCRPCSCEPCECHKKKNGGKKTTCCGRCDCQPCSCKPCGCCACKTKPGKNCSCNPCQCCEKPAPVQDIDLPAIDVSGCQIKIHVTISVDPKAEGVAATSKRRPVTKSCPVTDQQAFLEAWKAFLRQLHAETAKTWQELQKTNDSLQDSEPAEPCDPREAGSYDSCEDHPQSDAATTQEEKCEPSCTCPYLKEKQSRQTKERAVEADSTAVFGGVIENLKKLEHARKLFRVAEFYWLTGMVEQAEHCYREIQKIVPGSHIAGQAGERLQQMKVDIQENSGDEADSSYEEQDAPQSRWNKKEADRQQVARLIEKCLEAVAADRLRAAEAIAHHLTRTLSQMNQPKPVAPYWWRQFVRHKLQQQKEARIHQLLEACHQALKEGRYDDAERLADKAKAIDPECVAAHALVYKTHLLAQIEAKQRQRRLRRAEAVNRRLHLPPLDPVTVDALNKMLDQLKEAVFPVEEAEQTEDPCEQSLRQDLEQADAIEEETDECEDEDVFPPDDIDCPDEVEDEDDPCEMYLNQDITGFIHHIDGPAGSDEECESEWTDLIDENACIEIDGSNPQGIRFRCQIHVGGNTFRIVIDEKGQVEWHMTADDEEER